MKKIENNLKRDNIGLMIYYIYRGFKLAIFLLNCFVIYSIIDNNSKLLTLSLVLNIIYLVIYMYRIWIIIPSGIICFYLTNNIYLSICSAFVFGNAISYIIDFIIIFFMKIFLKLINKLDKNK